MILINIILSLIRGDKILIKTLFETTLIGDIKIELKKVFSVRTHPLCKEEDQRDLKYRFVDVEVGRGAVERKRENY